MGLIVCIIYFHDDLMWPCHMIRVVKFDIIDPGFKAKACCGIRGVYCTGY